MDGFDVAICIGRGVANKTTMANPSAMARTATKILPAPVGQVVKAMPGHVAVKVTSFLELAPGLANAPANLANIQKVLKDGRPGRDGARIQKGYCKKNGRVLIRIWWKKPNWVFGLHRAAKCQRGEPHVLVEEEKNPKDFLEGLLWLQERVCAYRRFGFCTRCNQELPEVEMYCVECAITKMVGDMDNTD